MSEHPSLRDELADQFGIDGQLAWRLLPLIDRFTVNWMTAATYANEDNLDCDRRTFFKLQEQLLGAGLIETTGRVTDPPENADFPQILRESGHARRKLTPAGRALLHKHRDRKEARFQIRLSRRLRKLERKAAGAAQRAGKREREQARAAQPKIVGEFPRDREPTPRMTAQQIDDAMASFEAALGGAPKGGADPPK